MSASAAQGPSSASDPAADVPAFAGLAWRRLAPELVPAWHALVEVATDADGGTEHLGQDDLRDELVPDWIVLGTDSVIGLDEDGVARAFGLVQVRPGDVTELRAHLWGVVHPDSRGRGIGRELVAWQERQARRIVAARRAVLGEQTHATGTFHVGETVTDAARLAERLGYRAVRWWSVMQRDLSEPLPDAAIADPGLRIVPFSAELDDPLRLAHNEAFAQHWHFQPWDTETWRQWETGHRDFRPRWSFAVLDADDRIAAYALSAGYVGDWEKLGYTEGWTAKLGVLPAWRGHGLAKALLAESMRAFAADGMQYAGLDVDAANPTGAVALYEGLGYRVRQRTAQWSKDL